MKWINCKDFILGKPFKDAENYNRLNNKDLETMTKLNPRYEGIPGSETFPYLGRCSSGLHVDFKTDSKNIKVRWKLGYNAIPSNMTAINQSGFDLYIKHKGKYTFLAVACPNHTFIEQETHLVGEGHKNIQNINEYMLNLPSYDQCTFLELGFDEDAFVEFEKPKPDYITVYGSSITQGGCASRPGMTYTNILRRHLGEEIYNLGMSGAGLLEHEMTDILNRLNPKIMVLDCVANMCGLKNEVFTERFNYFYSTFRKSHPNTPILVIEQPYFSNSWAIFDGFEPKNILLRDIAEKWNDKNVYYIKGDYLYGEDLEGTVDTVHATDVGFMRMCQIIEPVLKNILNTL